MKARELQIERFRKDRIYSNAQMRSKHLKRYCNLGAEAQSLLETAMNKLGLSARAYTRILKVSRTIADSLTGKIYWPKMSQRQFSTEASIVVLFRTYFQPEFISFLIDILACLC